MVRRGVGCQERLRNGKSPPLQKSQGWGTGPCAEPVEPLLRPPSPHHLPRPAVVRTAESPLRHPRPTRRARIQRGVAKPDSNASRNLPGTLARILSTSCILPSRNPILTSIRQNELLLILPNPA